MANTYENILSVDEVKHYLRLDSDFNEDNSDIERMIASSLEYITKQTRYYFKPQDKIYRQDYSSSIKVYDRPVNTTDFTPNIPLYYSDYILFKSDVMTLNIGFESKEDAEFPHALIDCALQMIKVFYYESEKNVNTTLLPESVNEIINTYRPAILFT